MKRFSGLALVCLAIILSLSIHPADAAPTEGVLFTDSGQALGNEFSTDVALGDLDGDGDPDAFVANGSGDQNQVWFNQGYDQGGTPGVFADSGQSLSNLTQRAVALGDLDGDADLDAFLVRGIAADSYQVWINQGGEQGGTPGIFQQNVFSVNDDAGTHVALGDVDGDGDLDAYISRIFDADHLYLNDGSGSFSDSGRLLEPGNSYAAALADLDGDGDLDVFATVSTGGNTVWINQGGNQGGVPGTYQDSGQALGSGQSLNVALRDLDGDGDADAFVANAAANSVWVNQGGAQGGSPGVFQDSGQQIGFSSSLDVRLADLDDDGDLDAFVAEAGANTVWVNQGGVQAGVEGVFGDSGLALGDDFSRGVALADVDGDADFDAFIANSGPAPNHVYLNVSNATSGWQIQTLDVRGDVGKYADTAVDSAGNPHISYYEQTPTSGLLKYAYWDGLSWHIEVVDDSADVGTHSAIVLDPSGRPHISYRDESTNDLKYASRASGSWEPRTIVAGNGDDGRFSDIAYHNGLHMSYIAGDGTLVFMEWEGSRWVRHDVAQITAPSSQSLAFDGDGNPHLTYYNGALQYASWDGSQWTSEPVDGVPGNGRRSVLAFDSLGIAHIVYDDALNGSLDHATFDGAGWTSGIITTAETDFVDFDLAIGGNAQPQVSYYLQGSLHVALGTGPGAWDFQIVDSGLISLERPLPGDHGIHTAIAWDHLDRPQVVYYDAQYSDLKYALITDAWQVRKVDTGGIDGSAAQSLFQGVPSFGVHSAVTSPPYLYLADWRSPDWQLDAVDVATQIDNPLDFAYDEDGIPHFAYYQAGDVYYATRNGGQWVTQLVHDVPVGASISPKLKILIAYGRPVILYGYLQDGFGAIIHAAPDDAGTWGRGQIGLYEGWSEPPSIFDADVMSSGEVALAYFVFASDAQPFDNLFLARWDGENWRFTSVQQDADITRVALAVNRIYTLDGAPDKVVVAYHDATNDQIKYAASTDETYFRWDYRTLVMDIPLVDDLAVALAENMITRPRLAYVDGSDNALYMMSSDAALPNWSTSTVRPASGEPRTNLSFDFGDRERLTYKEGTDIYHAFRTENSLLAAAQLGDDYPVSPIGGGQMNVCPLSLDPLGYCDAYPFGICGLLFGTQEEPASASRVATADLGDAGVMMDFTNLFKSGAAGMDYIQSYVHHEDEIVGILIGDPQLTWDGYRALQDFMPGLQALTNGQGSQAIVTQEMVDNAYSIWRRIADQASPELAAEIESELDKYNDLQDFAGRSFDDWALAIGVDPPANAIYLPLVNASE